MKDIDAKQDDVVWAVATNGMLWRAEEPSSTHGDLADKLCGPMGERELVDMEAYVVTNPYLKAGPIFYIHTTTFTRAFTRLFHRSRPTSSKKTL